MSVWIPQLGAHDEPLARLALEAGVADRFPGLALKLRADLGGQQSDTLRALFSQERLLGSEHDVITANQVASWAGESLSLQEAQARLNHMGDSPERRALWEAVNTSTLQGAQELDKLFSRLLGLRQQMAAAAGADTYADHVWQQTGREYTIAQTEAFVDDLAQLFAPLQTLVAERRARQLGTDRLRPWHQTVRVNALTGTPLAVEEYLPAVRQILAALDPAFAAVVNRLEREGGIDLVPRPGKVQGNFALLLSAQATARVLCNVTRGLDEFRALLHELGHAIHFVTLSSQPETTLWDTYDFQEVCEFYAFVFTMLGTEQAARHFDLSPEDHQKYRRSLAESFLTRLRSVDERVRFELWVYRQRGAVTPAEMDAAFLSLTQQSAVDWTGHEAMLAKGWQSPFLFQFSFYNIEYAIATIAALLFFKAYQEAPQEAMARFKRAMRMGATAGPTAIFAEAGISFPFSRAQLETARAVLADWLS
ncbi:M3 family metallopeptidase [Deinococcus sp. HMF7604]|uniref:M3 family metallopeptidase n=1 Tax=Deinococcus betulae TaxID=2873312 RepID=UPI001CCE0459|nr:M3 family metallopeptidase [Deinococcus betulae]MBZ9750258.1 M3 family metallopeptidase [Deinococcus betulae]